MTIASSPTRPANSILASMYVLACLVALVGLWRALPDVIDDAFITFRYGENLLAGRGLCFNPGQIVEGYSNPLFLFLLLPLRAAGVAFPIAARAMGLASFIACIIAAGGITRALGAERWQARAARGVVLAGFPLLYYSVTGLETGFFAALIAGALWRYLVAGRRVDGWGAALWLAVALTRPEGLLFPALLGGHELSVALGSREKSRRLSVAWLLAVAFLFGIFLIWRHAYFGRWLPNTFYAKPMGLADLDPNVSPLISSANYLGGFLFQSGALLPVLSLLALKRIRALAPLWLVVAGGFLFALYTGGDWMPAGRYLLPVFVPMSVLGIIGLGEALDWMNRRGVASRMQVMFAGAVIVAAIAMPAWKLTEFTRSRQYLPYHILSSATCREAAIAMREKYGSYHTIVDHRIGALGYYSEMHVLDLFGLVDVEIAEIIRHHPDYHPGSARGDDVPELRAYLARYRPDFVLVPRNPAGFDAKLREFYGFNYRLADRYPLGADQSWFLYERIDG